MLLSQVLLSCVLSSQQWLRLDYEAQHPCLVQFHQLQDSRSWIHMHADLACGSLADSLVSVLSFRWSS